MSVKFLELPKPSAQLVAMIEQLAAAQREVARITGIDRVALSRPSGASRLDLRS